MRMILVQLLLAALAMSQAAGGGEPMLKIAPDPKMSRLAHLSWDTEGGGKEQLNLLRPENGMTLGLRRQGRWVDSGQIPAPAQQTPEGGQEFRIPLSGPAVLKWTLGLRAGKLHCSLALQGEPAEPLEGLELRFAFNPLRACTTALSSHWTEEGRLQLPALLVAPDFGGARLAAPGTSKVQARLEGSRARHTEDLVLELPVPAPGAPLTLILEPLQLAPPEGLQDQALWPLVRRAWLNAFQATALWGDPGHAFSSPAGLLGNNVISDPASCSLHFYADMALFLPQLAPDVSIAAMVRRTIDFWLEKRLRPSGEMICYWDYGGFLDANAGPLISAWDYVESTGDKEWLAKRIERLEFVADFLVQRDLDGDGLVEAQQSGNARTLQQPARSCAWFDAVNCGYKEGYTNAQIYRAWCCLADLERQLGRSEKQLRYRGCADRLKDAYAKTLFNPRNGWLGWWKSQDGQLHDHASPIINSLAIEYGLVEPAQGRQILAKLRAKMKEAGFTRFELGVPNVLSPIPRDDYLQPNAPGLGNRPDGSDAFQRYQNGGINSGHALHFIMAHRAAGEAETGDRILQAMVERQNSTGFQNGAVNADGKGLEWTTWDGQPCGYEGHLADNYRFLLALLLRQEGFRERYYRPLSAVPQK